MFKRFLSSFVAVLSRNRPVLFRHPRPSSAVLIDSQASQTATKSRILLAKRGPTSVYTRVGRPRSAHANSTRIPLNSPHDALSRYNIAKVDPRPGYNMLKTRTRNAKVSVASRAQSSALASTSVIPFAEIWNLPSLSGRQGLSTILAIRSAPRPLRRARLGGGLAGAGVEAWKRRREGRRREEGGGKGRGGGGTNRVVLACAIMFPPIGFFWSVGPPGALSTAATTWFVTTTAIPNCS